jgi:hypothetical protein
MKNAASRPGHEKTKTSRQSRFPQNRLLVEDLTAVGYPRPAPLLAASDHVFFGSRTAGAAKRSIDINFISGRGYKLYPAPVIPGCSSWGRPGIHTHDGGYGFRGRAFSDRIDFVNFAQNARPGMTAILFFQVNPQP